MAQIKAAATVDRLADLAVVPSGPGPDRERIARLYRGAAKAAAPDAAGGDLPMIDILTIRDLFQAAPDAQVLPGAHALVIALFLAVREGSLCLRVSREAIASRLASFLPTEDANAHALAAVEAIDSPALRPILTNGNDSLPLVGDRFRPLIVAGGDGDWRLYFHRHFLSERAIRTELRRRGRTAIVVDNAVKVRALAEVLDDPDATPRLNEQQRHAVVSAVERPMTVVSGGPGTGKTTIVLTILRCLHRLGVEPGRMILAAPTGRAAQRMGAALRSGLAALPEAARARDAALGSVAGTTLHRMLAYEPGRGVFGRDRENPLDADVVIVDECSMADATLMARLLEAVPQSTRLVLIGDRDQLPSVEAGAVLAGILPDKPSVAKVANIGFVVLSTNYRSQPRIQEVAAAVNRGDASVVQTLARPESADEAMSHEGVTLVEPDTDDKSLQKLLRAGIDFLVTKPGPAKWGHLVDRLRRLEAHLPEARDIAAAAIRQLDRFRILTVTRQGPLGSVAINAQIIKQNPMRFAGGAGHMVATSSGPAFPGMPVMATSNDYARAIFNGDIGFYARDLRDNLLLWMGTASGVKCFTANSISGLEPAYAVTVHKGQGSECENLLLILPSDANHRLLTRQIIYTAITRAKRRAIIYGKPDALGAAISRPITRDSGELWG
jgi:exodeoxyribonuclease V alpha subunit